MNWDVCDFAVFGALLLGAASVYLLARRMTRNRAYRFGVGVAAVAGFLLLWVNGAAGIIGSERNDANMMFLGVLAFGAIGAAIARFSPLGMARALVATVGGQAAVALIGDKRCQIYLLHTNWLTKKT